MNKYLVSLYESSRKDEKDSHNKEVDYFYIKAADAYEAEGIGESKWEEKIDAGTHYVYAWIVDSMEA